MQPLLNFSKNYIVSMRLHFGFITALMGWIGLSLYEFLNVVTVDLTLKIFFIISVFLAYGINQIINDYLGTKEDKINAPERPMVTGELPALKALTISLVLMLLLCITTFFISPFAVIPIIIGVTLNIIYEFAKSIPLLGNLVFGLSILTCSFFGFLIAGPINIVPSTKEILPVIIYLVLINALMTYFTYFKDYKGDKASGKNTFIVTFGIDFSRRIGIAFALIPVLILLMWQMKHLNILGGSSSFWICFSVSSFLQLLVAFKYFFNPKGHNAYRQLVTNIQGCCAGQLTVLSIFAPNVALSLLPIVYILIEFIFDFHANHKA